MTDQWTEVDGARLTAKLVIMDGHRMPIRGADAREAVRLGTERGLTSGQIAERTGLSMHYIQRTRTALGLTPPVRECSYWSDYVNNRPAWQRHREAEKQANEIKESVNA